MICGPWLTLSVWPSWKKKNAVFGLTQTESGASYRNFIMVYDAGLALTWAVPSYETVTSRASWCGLQAMPVILAV